MAQDGTTAGGASYSLDNVTFPVGRNKLQSIFDAIRSTNIGNTAPDLVAGQFWIDNNTPSTTVWTLYFYDGTDSIQFATINTTDNTVNFIDSTFTQLTSDLSTNGNNINFGDNDKAQFGASQDLQIYHNGSNDFIESTSSYLILEGSNIILRNQAGTEDYAKFFGNGAVELYSDNQLKLATTSTGIDVTGTVVSDGLTVDGSNARINLGTVSGVQAVNNTFNATDNAYFDGTWKYKTDGRATNLLSYRDANAFRVRSADSGTADATITWKERLNVSTGGDISFYEDTGTTPKFYWDASTESLGIGTTSPSGSLTVEGDYLSLRVENTNTSSTGNAWQLLIDDDSTVNQGDSNNSQLYILSARPTSSTGNLIKVLNSGKSNTAFILKDNGNLGIGTSSPSQTLDIIGTTNYRQISISNSTSTETKRVSYMAKHYDVSEQPVNLVGMFADNSTTTVSIGGGLGVTGNFNNATEIQFHTASNNTTTGNSEAMRIDSSANLDMTNGGGNIILANGAGIDFSATANSSGTMSSELLDDYEEGTFTVSSLRLTGLTTNVGRYTKIGNLVTCEINLDWTSSDGTANDVIFTGLPFTTASGTEVGVGSTIIYGTDINTDVGAAVMLRFDDNQTRFFLIRAMHSSLDTLDANQMDGATTLRSTFTYMTS